MWDKSTPQDGGYETMQLAHLIAQTEKEIFAEANDEWDGEGSGVDPDDHSAISGWDGGDISETEGFNTAIHGFNENGHDRELELGEVGARDEYIERLENELGLSQNRIREINETVFNPERQAAQREQLRTQLEQQYGMIAVDDAQLDRFAADLQGVNAAQLNMQNQRIEASVEAARLRYGDEAVNQRVAEAFSMVPGSSRAADAYMQDATSARDFGEYIMNVEPPPHAVGARQPPGIPRGAGGWTPRASGSFSRTRSGGDGEYEGGFGGRNWMSGQSEGHDGDIFDSVWDR
jgi:hypothetical protein